jgi:adenylate cyclase
MGIEIERKFLVTSATWRTQVSRELRMVQGYLVGAALVTSGASRSSVRVRIGGEKAWLNIKSSTLGVERQEFEYEIPRADAERMIATLCDGVVDKVRHYVPVEGHEFEVDEFLGANAGLVVAELELDRVDAAYPKPSWLGAEVTSQARYYNLNLIDHPYAQWSAAEKAEH